MIYVLLAEGFEELEALTPVDIFRRAGKEVCTVAIGDSLCVCGSHSVKVEADRAIDGITAADTASAELLIIPGGMPGSTNIAKSEKAKKMISDVLQHGARVGAICAAPMVLGQMGLLCGKKAVCYPGFEKYLVGASVSELPVVTDGMITTARGAGAAMQFAFELVTLLCGIECAEKIKNGIIA